jgi:sn-glycerol 3-phosphate transport system ATP-binding protein
MSVMAIDGKLISGSSVAVIAATGTAHVAIRPEHVTLDGDIAAAVSDCEYLGADSLVRCKIGSEQITARIAGQREFNRGQVVGLAWPPDAVHCFNQYGLRVQ